MRAEARTGFWQSLAAADQHAIATLGQMRRFTAGTAIFQQDDRSDYVAVIMRGCIKVTTTSTTGYEAVLALRDAGDLIGEMAGLDGGPRSATLLALTEVDLLVVPAARFASLRSSRLAVEAAVNKVVSTRLREADRYRAAAGAQSAPQRLARLLLHLVERYGIADPEGTRIGMPLSHDDLAGLVLTSTRTVARILERWRDAGFVITRRRMVTVCQPDELRRMAETG